MHPLPAAPTPQAAAALGLDATEGFFGFTPFAEQWWVAHAQPPPPCLAGRRPPAPPPTARAPCALPPCRWRAAQAAWAAGLLVRWR
jgi:hypothetical protein